MEIVDRHQGGERSAYTEGPESTGSRCARPPGARILWFLALRLRGGDIAVEAEDVLWVVAVLEGDEALAVLWWVGGLYPFGARVVELHKVDVGVAGLEGAHRIGHVGEVSHDPFRHLLREGRPDPFIMNLESPLPMVLKCSALRVSAPPSCLSSSMIRGEPEPATSTSVWIASGERSLSISECWRAPIGSTGSMLMESIAA